MSTITIIIGCDDMEHITLTGDDIERLQMDIAEQKDNPHAEQLVEFAKSGKPIKIHGHNDSLKCDILVEDTQATQIWTGHADWSSAAGKSLLAGGVRATGSLIIYDDANRIVASASEDGIDYFGLRGVRLLNKYESKIVELAPKSVRFAQISMALALLHNNLK